jgi:uncharacterized membrane protein YbhN (UPF0104 family)
VARTAGGAAVLVFLVWHLGTGPFLNGLRAIDAPPVLAAAAITLVTTVSAAWRWVVVARGLGVQLPLRAAVAAYYRSQFLNTTLPGGVLGDAQRAVDHGRRIDDLGLGLRAVAWERVAGQTVQVAAVAAALIALPSPVRATMPLALGAAALVVLAVRYTGARWSGQRRSPGATPWARYLDVARSDVRRALLARRAWPAICLASLVAVAGHTAILLIAARVGDPGVPISRVLPLVLLVLLGSAIPLHVAGWGPREGVAAWAFGAAGLGAADGATVATVYGVLVIVSCLPGGALFLVDRAHRTRRAGPRQGAGVAIRPEVLHG